MKNILKMVGIKKVKEVIMKQRQQTNKETRKENLKINSTKEGQEIIFKNSKRNKIGCKKKI